MREIVTKTITLLTEQKPSFESQYVLEIGAQFRLHTGESLHRTLSLV